MKLSQMPMGATYFTQLGQRVLAVLVRREDGWCVYVDAVRGYDHDSEWERVYREGDKQNETVACAIVESLFHPGFKVDLPYVL